MSVTDWNINLQQANNGWIVHVSTHNGVEIAGSGGLISRNETTVFSSLEEVLDFIKRLNPEGKDEQHVN